MSYCHLAAVTGSTESATLLYDICRRLPLVGGFDHDGHHWVWLSAREAGEVIKTCRNTAAKYLEQLVKFGFLIREKLGEAQQFGRNRCWYYRPGPECPDFLLGKPVRTKRAPSCPKPERSTRTHSITHQQKRGASAQKQQPEQPHAIPDEEATKRNRQATEAMDFVPCPPEMRTTGGGTPPDETHETNTETKPMTELTPADVKPMSELTAAERQAVDELAKTMTIEEAKEHLDNDDLFLPEDEDGFTCTPKPEHKILVEAAFQVEDRYAAEHPEIFDRYFVNRALESEGVAAAAQQAQGGKLRAKPEGF